MAPDSPKSLWHKSAGRRASRRGAPSVPAPFVVGVNRSGTTLMRMMLDAHPDLTMPPETHFVPELIEVAESGSATPEALLATITKQREWGDFGLTEEQLLEAFRSIEPLNAGDALRDFYGLYAERIGKPRCGEKTPIYVKSIRKISGALPEARFLHVIRDGRDVALSIRDRATKEHTIEAIAERWVRRISQARRQSNKLPDGAYKEIRYEGPDPRHRGRPARGLRVLRAALGRRDPRLPPALRRAARGDEARAARRRQADDAQRRAADGDPRPHDPGAGPEPRQPLAREHGPRAAPRVRVDRR